MFLIADTRALVAQARERLFKSQQEAIKTCISVDNALTRRMSRKFERAKQKHLKEIKAYIKERQKADKRIAKALKRKQAKREREEAKRRRQEAKEKDENPSDGSLSSLSSNESTRKDTKDFWRDIEPLEGIFSLV